MSRRTDLINQLIQSDKFGEEKTNEQKFLAATAELILTDFINIASNGVLAKGAGSLIINLINDSTVYMGGFEVEKTSVLPKLMKTKKSLTFSAH